VHPASELDCAFESIGETCTFFQTSIEFRPVLQAQHDDAMTKHKDHRGQLFTSLLAHLDQDASRTARRCAAQLPARPPATTACTSSPKRSSTSPGCAPPTGSATPPSGCTP
jgi:hypothetical protein